MKDVRCAVLKPQIRRFIFVTKDFYFVRYLISESAASLFFKKEIRHAVLKLQIHRYIFFIEDSFVA
jgi:hypothetical protein